MSVQVWNARDVTTTSMNATAAHESPTGYSRMQRLVDEDYPDQRIVLVMGNPLNMHAPASLYEALELAEARRIAERLDIHYTPKHGSWLNRAKMEISAMVGQCLHRRLPDREAVRVNWRFTTAGARIKLKPLYPSVQK